MQKKGNTAASEQNQLQNSGATSGQRNGGVGLKRSAANNKKDDTICRWQRDHKITREVLDRLRDKRRKDAANTLGISESTFKRACRDLGITRWQTYKEIGKRKGPNSSLNKKQAVNKHIGTQPRSPAPGLALFPEEATPTIQGNSDMSAKVRCIGLTIRFPLPSASTMLWLKEKLGGAFKISIENFYIKYLDEEDEWITLMSDSELRHGMEVLRSDGRKKIRMKVKPKSQNLPSPWGLPKQAQAQPPPNAESPAGSLSNSVVGPTGSGKWASKPPPNGFGTTANAFDELQNGNEIMRQTCKKEDALGKDWWWNSPKADSFHSIDPDGIMFVDTTSKIKNHSVGISPAALES